MMKTKNDLKLLGTQDERVAAYRLDRTNNVEIKMLEHRLSYLLSVGVIESDEIDSLLERIAKVQEDLKWSWNVQYVDEIDSNKTA